MKQLSILAAILFFSLSLFAQQPGAMPQGAGISQRSNMGHVFGKLVDSTGKSISDASVMLLHTRLDTVTKKNKEVLLKGATTKANGEFEFEELPVFGQLKLKISATGYKPVDREIAFRPAGAGRPVTAAGNAPAALPSGPPSFEKDLGKIVLQTDIQQMQSVTVVASTSRMKMDIDKKVFNVDRNIVTAGGTGLDVMRNVPSVNVDIDGNVSLRNAAPQLFVDGRPTTLTLEQIPADAIESVEVITNPSAKYDASGGGAGILNVVLKKNKRTGYNGNLRAGIDRLGALNAGADFNARQGKVNFFGGLNLNERKTNTVGTVDRLNLSGNPQTMIMQDNKDNTSGRFLFGRAGIDWFATNRTTISAAGFLMNGNFKPGETIGITTDSLFGTGIKRSFSDRIASGTRENRGKGLSLGLKHLFPKEGQELTADANYFMGNNQSDALYTTHLYQGLSGSAVSQTQLQRLLSKGSDYNIVLQTDYVTPLRNTAKLEAGVRAAIRGRETSNGNYLFDQATDAYKLIPSTTNNYKNTDNVFAGYVSISNTIKNFGYKLGLRAESSNYTGELTQTQQRFSNEYPISLFPSLFVSQKLNNGQELQASITRRINRPNFFQLIPFADYTDPLNISQGNADLKPEFTTSYEASYAKAFKKNNSLLASLYYKNSTNLITRFLEPGTNPFTGTEAIINTYINANSSQTYGAEFTAQNFLTKWWDMTSNLNIYNGKINSDDKTIRSESLWSWFGKINSNFKLPSDFMVQLSATYQSKTNLVPGSGGGGMGGPSGARGGSGGGPGGGGFGQAQSASQGYIHPSYGIDLAIRKNFLKNNAASAILSFSDIFRTRNFNQHSESAYFIQDYSRLRDPQMVRLTLSYRFGKLDANLFKRKNNNTGSEAGQMQGM